MYEIVGNCIQHLRIGYFLFLLLLPFLFIGSYLFSRFNNFAYKNYQLVLGIVYYILLLNGNLRPFLLLLSMVIVNIIIMNILQLSKDKDLKLKVFNFRIDKFFLILAIILNTIPLVLMKDYIPLLKVQPNYFIQIIGISYFVLNSISMVIDYYKNKFDKFTTLDILVYSLYFPKIFAGPLVRFKEFTEELNNNYSNKSIQSLNLGLFLISFGIIKKWLADYIFQFSSAVISNPTGFSGEQVFLTIYMYTAYIFLDFSGYTDIARGTSLLMGINLPENFKAPYLATNFREFWRRWHITLYEWIKDYIYISLGGSRKGKFRTYINVIVAFVLSGMWHGNSINYIIWGFFHGIGVILSRFANVKNRIQKFSSWLITFNSVALLWVVFAITDFNKIKIFFNQIFTDFNLYGLIPFIHSKYDLMIVLTIGYILAFSDLIIKERIENISDIKYQYAFNFAIYILAILLLNFKVSVSPFLYENF